VDVNIRGYQNRTLLRYASELGHRDVVQCLIDHGAGVNSHKDDHNTPLNWAACRGHIDVLRVLLGHNADVNNQDEDGWTPLLGATRGYGLIGDYPLCDYYWSMGRIRTHVGLLRTRLRYI